MDEEQGGVVPVGIGTCLLMDASLEAPGVLVVDWGWSLKLEKKFVDRVMKVEDRYLTTDCLQEDYLEEIGVCVELDSDSPSIEQVTSTSMSSSSSDTD